MLQAECCTQSIHCSLHSLYSTSNTASPTPCSLRHVCSACAQGPSPVGAPPACSPGKTFRVTCFLGPSGYLVDVVYLNSARGTEVALCNAPQPQLEAASADSVEISAADAIVALRACQDSGGVRGLVFTTQLGEQLSCGAPGGHHCVPFSSRSVYPLRGLLAACGPAGRQHGSHAAHPRPHYEAAAPLPGEAAAQQPWENDFTRVLSITSACWVPQLPPLMAGASRARTDRGGLTGCWGAACFLPC